MWSTGLLYPVYILRVVVSDCGVYEHLRMGRNTFEVHACTGKHTDGQLVVMAQFSLFLGENCTQKQSERLAQQINAIIIEP